MGLFKKAAYFTDIHFGKRLDSEEHNKDCLEFLAWFIARTIALNCDVIIFGGDWFENKIRTENTTIYYSELGIRMLSECGIPVFWIIGNHDIYLKRDRRIHSLPYVSQYPNIQLINEVTLIDDVLLCPWPVNDEFAKIPDIKCKYIFGHFELPTFLMNQSFECPDNGGLHPDHFYQCEWVFSGHFHKKSTKRNQNDIPVTYAGNTFPHDFNDVHDQERGMMILEWGGVPQYESWPDAPNFHRTTISKILELMDQPEGLARFNRRSTIDCTNDLNISDEDMDEMKKLLGARKFIPHDVEQESLIEGDENPLIPAADYASFNDLVIDNLKKLDTKGRYQSDILIELFRKV
jgi:hypothetical protein